jgi:hypothetical protein
LGVCVHFCIIIVIINCIIICNEISNQGPEGSNSFMLRFYCLMGLLCGYVFAWPTDDPFPLLGTNHGISHAFLCDPYIVCLCLL